MAATTWLDSSSFHQSPSLERPRSSSQTNTVYSIETESHNYFAEGLLVHNCQHIKGHKTTWTQAALKLKSDHTFLLSGTPIPNWAHELWIPLRILHSDDEDQFPWNSRWRWLETWFKLWKPVGQERIEIGNLKGLLANTPERKKLRAWQRFYTGNGLDHLMLRRERDDVLPDLPALTEQYIKIPMTTAQRAFYDKLKKQYVAWVEETGTEVSAFSAGGLHIKLAQVQTGLASIDPTVAHMESNKLDAMCELLEARQGQPTLLVCHFRNTLAAISKRLSEMNLSWASIKGGVTQSKRDAAKDDFQAGKLNALVGTIDSIGEGLTLTRADQCIVVERSWKPYKNTHVIRRLHRIGQTRPVSIIYLISENAIDSRMTRRLTKKVDQQTLALSAGQLARML